MDDGPFVQENAKSVSANTLRNFFIIYSILEPQRFHYWKLVARSRATNLLKSLRPETSPAGEHLVSECSLDGYGLFL